MIYYLILSAFTAVIAYIVYILVKSDGSEYEDNSLDAFIDFDKGRISNYFR